MTQPILKPTNKHSSGEQALLVTAVLPKHIAIIMDGNNRFAKAEGLPSGQGHVVGKQALDPIVDHCLRSHIEALTIFAFSSENWQRPANEVALLMDLLAQTINEQLPKMHQHRIRLRFIGERSELSDKIQALMSVAEKETKNYEAMTLVIAISYGGQWDIVQAAKKLATLVQTGAIELNDITQDKFDQFVSLADLPKVDMLIRTGGEYRISNFLLWQSAYAELFFTDTLWPKFNPNELNDMFVEFSKRQRRFGKTSEQIEKRL